MHNSCMVTGLSRFEKVGPRVTLAATIVGLERAALQVPGSYKQLFQHLTTSVPTY